MDVKINNKGQINVFIILAVLLISIIALFLVLRSTDIPEAIWGKETNPNIFLKSCSEDKIRESLELISTQGGSAEPDFYKNFKFADEEIFRNISYLCYTNMNYLPCINQKPLLIQHLKEEIHDYISADIENCFAELITDLEDNGYDIDSEYKGFSVDLAEKKVIVDIDGELVLTKSGETSKEENFRIIIPSRFYDTAVVVQEITSQEAEYCNFDILGFMSFYPKFNINKLSTSDLEMLYTVQHRDTLEKFIFAVRSCVIPPGI